jgi:hypothetical protein
MPDAAPESAIDLIDPRTGRRYAAAQGASVVL